MEGQKEGAFKSSVWQVNKPKVYTYSAVLVLITDCRPVEGAFQNVREGDKRGMINTLLQFHVVAETACSNQNQFRERAYYRLQLINENRNLRRSVRSRIMERCSLLAHHRLRLSQPLRPRTTCPGNGDAHGGLGPPPSVNSQDNHSQPCQRPI